MRCAPRFHSHFLPQMIRIWDTSSYTLQIELRGHTDNVRTLALSQDGTLVRVDWLSHPVPGVGSSGMEWRSAYAVCALIPAAESVLLILLSSPFFLSPLPLTLLPLSCPPHSPSSLLSPSPFFLSLTLPLPSSPLPLPSPPLPSPLPAAVWKF